MKNINKKYSWLIIITLVIILCIVDYIIYVQKKDNSDIIIKQQVGDLEEKAFDKFTDSIVNEIDKINNNPKSWKVYQEKDYGVQFNYPSYYQIHKMPDSYAKHNVNREIFVTFSHYNDDFVQRIVFIISKNSVKGIFQDFPDSRNMQLITKNKEQNFDQYKIIRETSDETMYLAIRDDGKTRFIFTGNNIEIINKIISTFKIK
ncbi:hypothetical protein KAI92_02645 [Candidatus Parcubacteria bacterium]|nr:hypothetical protein [Candidatus Parcubacteria bacterium]